MMRLPILRDTIRKPYWIRATNARSPAVAPRLFNEDGVHIAELAHIEAAKPGLLPAGAALDGRRSGASRYRCHPWEGGALLVGGRDVVQFRIPCDAAPAVPRRLPGRLFRGVVDRSVQPVRGVTYAAGQSPDIVLDR
ncbi:hypothetical protein Acsp02_37840 [Actinoplanes sp. NBRC 103695]|nr:hypothetical protein Acsp02_37840 [Actinoplanes sp. NBRC 103695]